MDSDFNADEALRRVRDRANRLGADLGATTITETNSGHNIYMYNPELVIDSIEEVVDTVRAGDAD